MNVKDYIVHETERQSGTMAEAVGMFQAWTHANRQAGHGRLPLIDRDIKFMALCINGARDFRKVPAVFWQGTPALDAEVVPRAMRNLFEYVQGMPMPMIDVDAGIVVKEFLLIHPFADGNGRVGSLLWNWLRGTLDDPEPMPYFFGDK